MQTETPRQSFEKDMISQLEMVSFQDWREAMGAIGWLLHFDERFSNQPFSLVMEDIYGSVVNDQYVVAAMPMGDKEKLVPCAVLCWAKLNTITAVIRSNQVRPLAPTEYNSGDIGYFTIFASPFDNPDTMLELMRSKSKKLQELKSITFVDKLFKPDYTFRSNNQ